MDAKNQWNNDSQNGTHKSCQKAKQDNRQGFIKYGRFHNEQYSLADNLSKQLSCLTPTKFSLDFF